MPSELLAYTVREAARALRLRPITVRRLIAVGAIPAYRLGWRTFITTRSLLDFQAAHAVVLDAETARKERDKVRRRHARSSR